MNADPVKASYGTCWNQHVQSETKKIQTLGRPLGAQGPHLRNILAIVSVCVLWRSSGVYFWRKWATRASRNECLDNTGVCDWSWKVPRGVLGITLGRLWPQIRKRIQPTTLQALRFDRVLAPSVFFVGDLFSAFF